MKTEKTNLKPTILGADGAVIKKEKEKLSPEQQYSEFTKDMNAEDRIDFIMGATFPVGNPVLTDWFLVKAYMRQLEDKIKNLEKNAKV